MDYDHLLKCIIVGDSGVGKSSLLLRFTDSRFNQLHDVTVGVGFGWRIIPIRGKRVKLHLWDTAGQEGFRSVTRAYYRMASVAMLVYDVTKRSTFEAVDAWWHEVSAHTAFELVYVLVGNKTDLETNRQVSSEEGSALAASIGAMFCETSALRPGSSVESAFYGAAEVALDRLGNDYPDPPRESQSSSFLGLRDPPATRYCCEQL